MALETRIEHDRDLIEVGLDEAGRGPLIGRVYAGAVIWPSWLETELVNDSKKMSASERSRIYKYIKENAIDWAIGYSDEKEIDYLTRKGKGGILEATRRSMHRALDKLSILPDLIIVDGRPCNFSMYEDRLELYPDYTTVERGDAIYTSIAGASILAKVDHDQYISDLCDEYPELEVYGIRSNKGYGSSNHLRAIEEYGVSPFHRLSFKRCNEADKNLKFDWDILRPSN